MPRYLCSLVGIQHYILSTLFSDTFDILVKSAISTECVKKKKKKKSNKVKSENGRWS